MSAWNDPFLASQERLLEEIVDTLGECSCGKPRPEPTRYALRCRGCGGLFATDTDPGTAVWEDEVRQ